MKKQNVKKIYRASVRIRFESVLDFVPDTYSLCDLTLYKDYHFDPRGLSSSLSGWLDEIKKSYEAVFVKFLTTPEVEEIEVDEGLCANL